MNILQINASARADGHSTRVANDVTASLKAKFPSATVNVRDLASNPHPVLDGAALGAIFTPADQRSHEQSKRAALDDSLINEVREAEIVVLGVPMYNFGISVQLKTWIDAIAKAGVTFRYTENGPEGLLKNKKVYVALARGGRYRDTPADTQVPYLRAVLGFLGMSDVEFFYAEGLNMGPDGLKNGLEEVASQIKAAFA